MIPKENPFFHNYVFGVFDLNRVKIKWYEYPVLCFKPAYVQLNEGYAFTYKQIGNRYYLMKVEEFELWKGKEQP